MAVRSGESKPKDTAQTFAHLDTYVPAVSRRLQNFPGETLLTAVILRGRAGRLP